MSQHYKNYSNIRLNTEHVPGMVVKGPQKTFQASISKPPQQTVQQHISKCPQQTLQQHISKRTEYTQNHSNMRLTMREPVTGTALKGPQKTFQPQISRPPLQMVHPHISKGPDYLQNNSTMRHNITVRESLATGMTLKSPQKAFQSLMSKHPQQMAQTATTKHFQKDLKESRPTWQTGLQTVPRTQQKISQKMNKKRKKNSKNESENKKPVITRPALTPETVLRSFGKQLTVYEQEEIKTYDDIWYVGEKVFESKVVHSETAKFNGGYDDEGGLYNAIKHDHLAYRFEVLQCIGSGYSGQVFKCKDHKTNEVVAVKVIRNTLCCHRFGEEEVKNLKALQKTDKKNKANIVHMKEHFYFRNHLCITFEFFQKDLQKALKESRKRGFTEDEVRKYAIDVLKCLQVLKRKKIIHGDLKPENILLHTKGGATNAAVADFGGSCFEKDSDCPKLFTVAYVSPEILLGKRCSTATDMWSLGCTLAKLYLGSYLFEGLDNIEQFICIMKVLGVPPATLLNKAPKRHFYFDSNGVAWKIKEINRQRTSLATKLKSKDADFLDFIERCLEYNPRMRMTPEKALEHPWIKKKQIVKPVKSNIGSSVVNKNTRTTFPKKEKVPPP